MNVYFASHLSLGAHDDMFLCEHIFGDFARNDCTDEFFITSYQIDWLLHAIAAIPGHAMADCICVVLLVSLSNQF